MCQCHHQGTFPFVPGGTLYWCYCVPFLSKYLLLGAQWLQGLPISQFACEMRQPFGKHQHFWFKGVDFHPRTVFFFLSFFSLCFLCFSASRPLFTMWACPQRSWCTVVWDDGIMKCVMLVTYWWCFAYCCANICLNQLSTCTFLAVCHLHSQALRALTWRFTTVFLNNFK